MYLDDPSGALFAHTAGAIVSHDDARRTSQAAGQHRDFSLGSNSQEATRASFSHDARTVWRAGDTEQLVESGGESLGRARAGVKRRHRAVGGSDKQVAAWARDETTHEAGKAFLQQPAEPAPLTVSG